MSRKEPIVVFKGLLIVYEIKAKYIVAYPISNSFEQNHENKMEKMSNTTKNLRLTAIRSPSGLTSHFPFGTTVKSKSVFLAIISTWLIRLGNAGNRKESTFED